MNILPDFDRAVVEAAKVVDYLLGSSGPASVAKARFFSSLGFSVDRWEELVRALRTQAGSAAVTTVTTSWGTKHIAAGNIDAPNGGRYKIISVWIEEGGRVRLVTAYPAKG